jgi:hypothetical protein
MSKFRANLSALAPFIAEVFTKAPAGVANASYRLRSCYWYYD